MTVEEIHTDDGDVSIGEKGEIVSVKVDSKIRENDKVYLIREREC